MNRVNNILEMNIIVKLMIVNKIMIMNKIMNDNIKFLLNFFNLNIIYRFIIFYRENLIKSFNKL